MNQGVFLPPVPASDIPASLVPGARGLFSAPPLVGSLHLLEPEFDPTRRFSASLRSGSSGAASSASDGVEPTPSLRKTCVMDQEARCLAERSPCIV